MNRSQTALFETFSNNGGEDYLNQQFGESQVWNFGLRPETNDYHKTVKAWFRDDECMARILIYRNTPPAEDQIVIRQYLGDYCD
jgi:hypothetical protein